MPERILIGNKNSGSISLNVHHVLQWPEPAQYLVKPGLTTEEPQTNPLRQMKN
jgi:hypothetical protein